MVFVPAAFYSVRFTGHSILTFLVVKSKILEARWVDLGGSSRIYELPAMGPRTSLGTHAHSAALISPSFVLPRTTAGWLAVIINNICKRRLDALIFTFS